jgi:hypothetical protein
LIFSLALFWSSRGGTEAAVLAERFEVVIQHWRQDELNSATLALILPWIQWRRSKNFFLQKSKSQHIIIFSAAAPQ